MDATQLAAIGLLGSIWAVWPGDAARAAEPLVKPGEPLRITLEINRDGKATFEVQPLAEAEKTAEREAEQDANPNVSMPKAGEPFAIRSMPSAEVMRLGDGVVRIVQPIASPEDLKAIAIVDGRNRLRTLRSEVVIASAPTGKFGAAKHAVDTTLYLKMRLPVRFAVDVAKCDLEMLAFQLWFEGDGASERLTASVNATTGTATARYVNTPINEANAERTVETLASSTLQDGAVVLLFDAPEWLDEQPMTATLQAFAFTSDAKTPATGQVVLTRIVQQGRLVPTLGVIMFPQDGAMVVSKVLPGSLGEAGGLQGKDIVLRVGQTPIADIDDVRGAFASQVLGRPIPIVIRREGVEQTLLLKTQ